MTEAKRSRTVLITGAATRVGAAIARGLAAAGWNVIVHYHRSEHEGRATRSGNSGGGGVCDLVRADLGNRHDVEGLMEKCVAVHGTIDCLINNASAFRYDDIASVTWESLHDHLASNLIAPVFLCRDFVRQFGARTDGCIINILDQKIANLNPDFLSYTIGKIGLAGLTTTLAMALAGRIRVCGIAPGLALISGKQTAGVVRQSVAIAAAGPQHDAGRNRGLCGLYSGIPVDDREHDLPGWRREPGRPRAGCRVRSGSGSAGQPNINIRGPFLSQPGAR